MENDVIYIKIPYKWSCIYQKILIAFADLGIDMLKDCNASCTSNNKSIINCFNMFNAAIAAYELRESDNWETDKMLKQANTIIKYIEAQLNIHYKGDIPNYNKYEFNTNNGKLYTVIACAETPQFYVDVSNGRLYKSTDFNNADFDVKAEYENVPSTGN